MLSYVGIRSGDDRIRLGDDSELHQEMNKDWWVILKAKTGPHAAHLWVYLRCVLWVAKDTPWFEFDSSSCTCDDGARRWPGTFRCSANLNYDPNASVACEIP